MCGHYIVHNDKPTAIQVIKNKYGHSLDDSRRMLMIVESWYTPIQWGSMIKHIREFNPEYLL